MSSRARTALILAACLLIAHGAVVTLLGTSTRGPVLSDAIEVAVAGLAVFHCIRASGRSSGLARSFWALAATTFAIALVDFSLMVGSEFFPPSVGLQWVGNLLGCFWFFPLALGMFLDPERETEGLDLLVAVDFLQAAVFCVAAYLYFFFIPKSSGTGQLGHSAWTPYFFAYAFLGGAFWLRSVLTRSPLARSLFRGVAIFLFCSDVADVLYRYGPFHDLRSGSWFDLVWNLNLAVPLVIAAAWEQPELHDFSAAGAGRENEREKKIYTEIFYLFFPLLILVMSFRIAHVQLGLAGTVILLSFAGSSTRLLVTQHRLVKAQDALRWEATRDGLTGLWNRTAVLEILERELQRSERHGLPVGVIMADIDHFKAINDSRGHAAGDKALEIIASEIGAVVRPYDSVGRYGGEEFLIVAPGCGPHATWELAERIRAYVSSCSIVAGGTSLKLSLSLGFAAGSSSADMERLLHDADTALYQAKNAGRDRVEPSLGQPAPSATPMPAKGVFWV
jgi:diguanylate cyclase (GGDEF)-like protein